MILLILKYLRRMEVKGMCFVIEMHSFIVLTNIEVYDTLLIG